MQERIEEELEIENIDNFFLMFAIDVNREMEKSLEERLGSKKALFQIRDTAVCKN